MIDERGPTPRGGARLRPAPHALVRSGAPRPSLLARLLVRHRADAVGMARQGYDLQLTRYDEKGWRATFYTTGMEHSITSATASAWERTPWHATQRAAWERTPTPLEI